MEPVLCDFCTAQMTMKSKGHFVCGDCGQDIVIHPAMGLLSTKIILYPSRMNINKRQYREDYLPWWYRKERSRCLMFHYSGFWDEHQKNEFIKKLDEQYNNWFENNPLPPKWKFWKYLFW